MKTIFTKLFKAKTDDEEIEISEEIIKESRKPQKRIITDYKDYLEKDIEWLKNHIEKINEVVNKQSIGSRNKASFVLDGKKYFKDDVTKELFNKMFDNYTAYYYALKRFLIVRIELNKYNQVGEDKYLIAGQIKELETEAKDIEKNLNLYLDNINRLKNKIREEVGL